jgi:benzylsuccinate CoA-transferase BbsF subunit
MAGLPLEGIRIADFTWIIAGPYGAYLLARMGAEVIHIEGLAPPDHIRDNPPHADGIAGLNRSGFFNSINAGKKSVTLDLRSREHVEIAKQIIAKSDAVIESYSPGTMAKLGLGYDDLHGIRSDAILVSCSGFGQTGPDSKLRAYMGTVHACAGLNSINGYAGGPPRPLGGTWADYVTGVALVFAVLGALHHRERTGRGQWIDLSMAEAAMSLMGVAFTDYFLNGHVAGTIGNSSTTAAPNDVYPSRGDDAWVAISVESDAQWNALVAVVDDDALRGRSYRDVLARRRDAAAIDERIAAWSAQRSAWEAAEALARAGVPAAPTCGTAELLEQPQLRARSFFVEPEHPEVGRRAIPNMPWRISPAADPPCAPAPLLGEHNSHVLGDLLRLPRETIEQINAAVADVMRKETLAH